MLKDTFWTSFSEWWRKNVFVRWRGCLCSSSGRADSSYSAASCVGAVVGTAEGLREGEAVGLREGCAVGTLVGAKVVAVVGFAVGLRVGPGVVVGKALGTAVLFQCTGCAVGLGSAVCTVCPGSSTFMAISI
jgi:hypothetical protein